MSTDSLELIDLSHLEDIAPVCDYGGWEPCPNTAVWIMYHKTVQGVPCCGVSIRPFRLLCQTCLDRILNAESFVCKDCGQSMAGDVHRQLIDRIERL